MQKIVLFTIVSVLLVASCQPKKHDSLQNNALLSTVWFQKSAEMRACYYQTYSFAYLQLVQNKNNYVGSKPTAVVLDIDETVLDNSPYQASLILNNKSYESTTWKAWTDKASAKALPGAVEFTQKAKNAGVNVIYISNRKTNELSTTLTNLNYCGFADADSSHVFLSTGTSDKTERRNLVSEKYDVLLYIGDALTDFDQIFAHRDSNLALYLVDSLKNYYGNRYIILPNPTYGEWENAVYKYNYTLTVRQKSEALRGVLFAN